MDTETVHQPTSRG